ncbi:VanZ like protein [Ulvibacter sp. MAR_2010_11]|uniref:VanZ family protein n=1 Tax=Ulvibacter sp. MAR_2010_11 TaxID=1250229 RepID=UPI000C2B7658|nr:VanZ family protein [Ulvibacter sp. MAR_2010_11]PKA81989.1 VanZ like protein [Ulvibacter sp. MAR_2010_11]
MKKKIKITSRKERKLWISALVVLIAIYATLFLGGQLLDLMVERRIIEQGLFYLFLLLFITFIISGWKSSRNRLENWIYAGVIAVYGMALLRMDITTSERSHMIEYGLLSILIYEALIERKRNGVNVKIPVLTSILGAGTIGLLDECIQYFLSYRIFDMVDIGFNYLASAFGVITSIGVRKLKQVFTNWQMK